MLKSSSKFLKPPKLIFPQFRQMFVIFLFENVINFKRKIVSSKSNGDFSFEKNTLNWKLKLLWIYSRKYISFIYIEREE